MKKPIILFTCLIVFLAAGCSTPTRSSTNGLSTTAGAKAGSSNSVVSGSANGESLQAVSNLNRDKLATYSASFRVQFDGPKPWTYQLKTRKSAALSEVSLHIEGIQGTNNPGDIRMVTDGATTWMLGAGTDKECIQFPNNKGMDPSFIYPESLIPVKELTALLKPVGKEDLNGTPSQHYTAAAPSAGGWKDVRAEVWQDQDSQALLKYTLQASGKDTFFATGSGKLTAQYQAGPLDVKEIAAVKGCQLSVPLPKSISNFVRLPGMASFDSASGMEQIRAFYQAQLPQKNWAEKEVPAIGPDSIVLSYVKDGQEVEIHIETDPNGGSKVKLLFVPVQ